MMPSREEWLGRLVDALRPTFAEHGSRLPERIRVSCGWPSRSALSGRNRRIGEAWSHRCSDDGASETFVSPTLADPVEVGAVLVHELVHHAVGVEAGHKGPFRRLALAVGLAGKMTATVAGPELAARLHALAEVLGPYPHAALNGASGRKKQTTRMLKVTCAACGCIARMARQWLDEVGAPTCACGGDMAEGGAR
ncbi:MAG: transcription elongation protein SprT [Planctomycetes bacterium]|nr:transcription elongation protein SprT [Planctomycetota bacterium]